MSPIFIAVLIVSVMMIIISVIAAILLIQLQSKNGLIDIKLNNKDAVIANTALDQIKMVN